MDWSIKRLPHKLEDVSWEPQNPRKNIVKHKDVCLYPSMRELETDRSLSLLTSQATQLVSSRLHEKPCLKK